ncbi:MAG: CPBP family intramembrane metalloprotease [Caldilineaceae bacterium]|nr:CPBP family intramembrane metalloprotease [Caldilineaceae bacterium]
MQVRSPWTFFALAYAGTWLFWIPAAVASRTSAAPVAPALQILGGLALTAVALTLVYRTEGPDGRRNYGRRLLDTRRIGVLWCLVSLLLAPLLTFGGALTDWLLGGPGLQAEAWAAVASHPIALVALAAGLFVFGPVPEEMAWRGYGLDVLQARFSPLGASLILGLAWTIWHFPLFFIAGTYQQGLIGTASFWLFFLDKPAQSVVMTWVYNNTRRSILSAILIHFSVNFVGELFALSWRGELIYILLWIGAAVVVTLRWRTQMLLRSLRAERAA